MPANPLPLHRLLDAALTIFLRSGYGGASMAAIAAEAGVARRTLFNRFDSKEALFEAAVERFWARMPIALPDDAAAGAGPEAPEEGLLRIGAVIVDFWAAPEAVALARLVIAESLRFPLLARTYLDRGKLPSLAALIVHLEELSTRNAMVIPDPDLAARQFVGMLNEPLLWFRVLGADEEHTAEHRHHVVREAVRVFMAAYPLVDTPVATIAEDARRTADR